LVGPLTDKTKIYYLGGIRRILETFILNWKLFLGIHIAVNALSFVLLTPLITLILGWLMLASGHKALTDEDILFFILSPTGLTVALLAGALYTTVVIFQQAAMIIASRFVTRGNTVSLVQIGRLLLVKFLPLFRLALQMIGRTALIAAPFLAICALIYYFTLTEFDINYYLTDRPAVFWWAGGLIVLCLLIMAGVLLRIFSGWILALPLLLINSESPAQSLWKSRTASISRRIPIALTLLFLLLLNTGLLGLASLLTDLAVNGAVSLAGDSLQAMAYLLGSLMIVWLVTNVAIAFFINSALALVILSLFTRLIITVSDKIPDMEPRSGHTSRRWHITAAQLAGLALIISLATGIAIRLTMDRFSITDNTMVIAHRGASADAPENSLAAIELAINEGADWVEIDVQETLEGEVVVIHDSDLKKIGGSGLKVFEASLPELQSVDIGSWMDVSFSDQRVPTLQQVLALCKDRINIIIELKYYGKEQYLEERVAKLVEAANMQDQIVVMSLSYPGIQKMKSIRPDWMVGLLSSVAIGDITQLNADFFAINASFAKRRFIQHAHSRNRKVLVWTINDPISMSAMMSKGVDGIITDKPALALNIRKERAELDVHERMMIQLASFIGKQPTRPEQ
jgi:glycerophosphoryl diester phosphodiesterase